MESKKLEILQTVVDLGSFTKASEVVGYTQSGLTHLMDSLEREIGFPLIERTHSGVRLTENGKALLPAIRAFLRADADLANRIEAIRGNRTRTVRIAAYASIAMHWMPEILYRFRRLAPDVDVDLRMVDNALEPFELLQNGKTDVIFASRQDYSGLDWTPLYKEKMFAILPKNYPVQDGTAFPVSELNGQEFLMPYGKFDLDLHRLFRRHGVTVREKTLHVDDETVIRMVGRGLGVTVMSELMIRGRTDDVRCIPLSPLSIRELGMGLPATGAPKELELLRKCVLQFIEENGLKNT